MGRVSPPTRRRCCAAGRPARMRFAAALIRSRRSAATVRHFASIAPSSAASTRLIMAALLAAFGNSDRKEHTSELQSLMRISYAVFCLKKNKKYMLQNVADIDADKQL